MREQHRQIYNITEGIRRNCEANISDAAQARSGDSRPMCPGVFDSWVCWPDTEANTSAVMPCPYFIIGFDPKLNAHRDCLSNGSWFRHPETGNEWSNYTTCINYDDLAFRNSIILINELGYSISLFALLLSLGILFYFKALRCTRITLHMNLFGSFAINCTGWLLFYGIVVPNSNSILNHNPEWCQLLHVVTHYFLLSNYCWMLAEGLYLHTVLVNAFGAEERLVKWLYLLGWAVPLPIIVVYGVMRGLDPDARQRCWMDDTMYNFIMAVPVCFSLVLNFVFLLNIVRVLWSKLRAGPMVGSHSERPSRTLLQAVRATLLLLPLLGLQYLVTPFRPDTGSMWERFHEVVSAFFTSFQGFAVATLFCFCNGEVLAQMRRRMDFVFQRRRANSYTATTVSL
ncbi:calcitonin receptor [Thrips palmi]|uniref:Calcitonin receptor n=1 Tax=Thrips palmi TaxID=161013 RepID=A0A6P8YZM1_THRPL|nr:calcitonin receptor [Thrips palmi]